MKLKTTQLALLAVLLFASVQAQEFSETNPADNNVMEAVGVDDADTSVIVSYRNFSVDADSDVYVSLANPLPSGYLVDVYVTDDGTTYTLLAEDVTGTEVSELVGVTALGEPGLRFDITLPGVLVREAGQEDHIAFIVALNATTDEGGNGGTLDPSFGHVVSIFYYDAATDSDADGLPDAWEDEHFGNLDQLGSDDPDGDGFSNAEEYEAGSDPNDPNSTPESIVVSGGGVEVTDRHIGNFGLALFLFAGAMLIVFLILPQRKEKRAAAIGYSIIGAFVVAMVVFIALDMANLGRIEWAWWSYLGITWEVATTFMVASAAVLFAAGPLAYKFTGKKEGMVGWYALGLVILVGLVLYVLHAPWAFDVSMDYLK